MTTEQYFGQFDITMEQARDFFFAFLLTETQMVYEICQAAGITNDMIADVLGNDFPELTGEMVSTFWDMNGLPGSALNGSAQSLDFSYSLQNGILTNTGTDDIVITDVGFDMDGTINISYMGQSQSMTFSSEGSIEQGYYISVTGQDTHYVQGMDFPDEIIPAYANFDANNFLPDDTLEAFQEIPFATGSVTMEMSLITTVGTFSDSAVVVF